MAIQLKPYEGSEPYIFVSYAHRDMEAVLPVIQRLTDEGYRVWYDEGIDPGTEWDTNIAVHIERCASFVAFISENYLRSDNCKDELNFARDLEKERLLVYLEDAKLPLGMAMRLNRLQAIHKYTYEDPEDFYGKLLAVPQFVVCRKLPAPAGSEGDALPELQLKPARIKVIGLGGAGCNTVSRLIEHHPECVEYISVNTDLESLSRAQADRKLLIGNGMPHIGQLGTCQGVEDVVYRQYHAQIKDLLADADLVFLTCGMGGAAGTGAVSAVAHIAREMELLTVGVVSVPFRFEGSGRTKIAQSGVEHLKEYVDTAVVLHNDQLLSIVGRNTTMPEALRLADETLCQCILGISDLISSPGVVRLDMDDLRSALRSRGTAFIGVGAAEGEKCLNAAATQAVTNPMLMTSFQKASTVLVNITGPGDISIGDIREASQIITDAADPGASIVLGTAVDESMSGKARVLVIATGLD
ncbi:MAG: TIR domain-containing protein [Clostridia bacterium]|nr:TIR domain-containing protein [Clostridia bacterium]